MEKIKQEEIKHVVKEFKDINKSIKNRIATLSLTVMATIFVLIDKNLGVKENIGLYKNAFLLYVIALGCEIFGMLCSSKHYEQWIEGRTKTIDFRESVYGRLAEWFFWGIVVFFVAGSVLFVMSIIKLKLPVYVR